MVKYHYPAVAVDVIVEKDEKLLLIKRRNDPFKGLLAIPGGFVNEGERVEDTAVREMLEETNLNIEPINILGAYSDPKRDPRGHVITIAFIGKIIGGEVKAGDDADDFEWISYEELKDKHVVRTFDHNKIMEDYREWKKTRGTYWSSKVK
ncbi:MAG: NUDIX hydrolase [Thermoproteota archaeon]|nr:NUDIX hydrolase [Thermoproteota archaeon]